jgi:hypothetical protein
MCREIIAAVAPHCYEADTKPQVASMDASAVDVSRRVSDAVGCKAADRR